MQACTSCVACSVEENREFNVSRGAGREEIDIHVTSKVISSCIWESSSSSTADDEENVYQHAKLLSAARGRYSAKMQPGLSTHNETDTHLAVTTAGDNRM